MAEIEKYYKNQPPQFESKELRILVEYLSRELQRIQNHISTPTIIGYTKGDGGTITQITSRTTGVTLNKSCGGITLFTAAGSATPATFTVSNSLVVATDLPRVCCKSSTNVYLAQVTAVATGSFNITFWTTGGTSSDTPVFTFDLGRAVTS